MYYMYSVAPRENLMCMIIMSPISVSIANPTRKFIPGDVCSESTPALCNDDEYVMLKDATTVVKDIRKSLAR